MYIYIYMHCVFARGGEVWDLNFVEAYKGEVVSAWGVNELRSLRAHMLTTSQLSAIKMRE